MLEFKNLEIEDKEIINQYLKIDQKRNSESSFTNFYMWRKSYYVKYAVFEDNLIVRCGKDGEWWYLPPYGAGDWTKAIEEMMATAAEMGVPFQLKAVGEQDKIKIESLFPEKFDFTAERENFDYIYDAESLRTLAGRKLHAKRNHLNHFLQNENYTYEPLCADNLTEAAAYLEKWCAEKACDSTEHTLDEMLVCEREAIHEIFNVYDKLDCEGALIRINGAVQAFTLGEMINNDTVLIHVEKAEHEIRGLYPAINQMFLSHAFPNAVWVNREEDTGDEGLRQAKLSYLPAELWTKYKGVLR